MMPAMAVGAMLALIAFGPMSKRAAGLTEVREMDRSQVRGYDHGWINLGMRGIKSVRLSAALPTEDNVTIPAPHAGPST